MTALRIDVLIVISRTPGASLSEVAAGVTVMVEVRHFRATKLREARREEVEGSKTGDDNGHKMPSFRTGTRTAGSDTPLATGSRAALLEEMVVAHQRSDLLLLNVGRRYLDCQVGPTTGKFGATLRVIIGLSRTQYRDKRSIKPIFSCLIE
jgi:hypothetical protein